MAKDMSVPDTIRARAIQMASSLGIDAVQLDPSMTGQIRPALEAAGAPAGPHRARQTSPAPAARRRTPRKLRRSRLTGRESLLL
jgi:phage terminase large subunit-like protein